MRRVKNTMKQKDKTSLCTDGSLCSFENLVNYLNIHKGNSMHLLNPGTQL